ncbi:CAP domain-containing protein [Antribacter gilvus]|uniref:CAP domain-containing protein n=1 Tax=Antribacter gilvus TaxID=2304675 RepID=UPI00197F80E7|nr:CAP domain-containing protein [Antribacter gilvus]
MAPRIRTLLLAGTIVVGLGACSLEVPGTWVTSSPDGAPSATPSPPPAATPAPEATAPASGGAEGGGAEGDLADPAGYAAVLEGLVNDQREAAGLPALAHDGCAAEQAQSRADALVGAPELEHAPLGGVLGSCGVGLAGENLSRGESPPEDVVEAWMASPGHHANIVKPEFASGAIACTRDGGADPAPRFVCSHVFLGG